MGNTVLKLAALIFFPVAAFAQGGFRGIQIDTNTNRILGLSSVKFPSGMTLEVEAGASLLANGSNLTSLNASQLTSGIVPAARLNGLTINATTGTLSIGLGKTLTASNSITVAGADGSTLNIGSGGALGSAAFTASTAYQPAGSYQVDDPRFRSLTSLSLVKSISTIVGTSTGLSGATYNPRSGTVFIVRNVSGAAGTIYELTTDGAVIRTITNSNFIDTEAIEWVGYDAANGADVFIVGEEDHTTAANESQLTLCRLTPAATTLDRTAAGNVTVQTAYSGGNIANLGLEAIAYDSKRGMVYYTIEKQTAAGSDNTAGSGNAKIFQRSVTSTGTLAFGAESVLCNINSLFTGATLTDISDATYDPNSDTILLQSDESKKVVRLSLTGTLIEQIATSTATQPEGLAIHPDGTQLFVIGEPQEFFRYEMGIHRQQANSALGNVYPTLATVLNTQTGTAYTLTAADNGKVVTLNNAAAITLTVPTGLPSGYHCRIIQLGAGLVTVTASGTTVNSFGGTLALGGQYAAGDIQGTATANTFVLIKHQ